MPSESTFKVLTSKIEVKLKKANSKVRWGDLKMVPNSTLSISNREMKNWNEIAQICLTQVRSHEFSAKNGPFGTISLSNRCI